MGIPSYFSYIVKNHNNIIKKLNVSIDYFFLDSNSIIYDCLREIDTTFKNYKNKEEFEEQLIQNVCLQITKLYRDVKPKKMLYISFDGVAPIAKLEQQRNRRFKSYMEDKLDKDINPDYMIKWNKSAITPGTKFMKNLTSKINIYFNKLQKRNLKHINIIVSSSDEVGEGEHKIFSYIRNNNILNEDKLLVYGLDADLIMLALNHLDVNKNIYLYRETPEFIKSIDKSLNPNEKYMLDIPLLGDCIIHEMSLYNKNKGNSKDNRLHDYIFLCFFLGNDFLPHFPAVNIRTNGIDIMINAYKEVIGNSNKYLCDGRQIKWNNVCKLIEYLSDNEWDYLIEQTKIRDKQERRLFLGNNYDDKKKRYLNIPIKNRVTEKYIDVFQRGWEGRYYDMLLKCDDVDYYKKKISLNYLEGLEWTMKYYSGECPDWNWKYKYAYPPLLKDLKKYIPSWDYNMIGLNDNDAIKSNVQLAYVLPKASLDLLDSNDVNKLMKNIPDLYDEDDVEIEWSYCKYMWESHVLLPELDINYLDELLNEK